MLSKASAQTGGSNYPFEIEDFEVIQSAVQQDFAWNACQTPDQIVDGWHIEKSEKETVSIYSKFKLDGLSFEGNFSNSDWADVTAADVQYSAFSQCINRMKDIAYLSIYTSNDVELESTKPPTTGNTNTISGISIRASRIFAGPDQYPPAEFAAYGILAFQTRAIASNEERERHLMICNAYVSAIPHSRELDIPLQSQMVTVWPIETNSGADIVNNMRRNQLCDYAVDRYGLVGAQKAIREAMGAGFDPSGQGPFLLAWSPAAEKGMARNPILVGDLSNVTQSTEARRIFIDWLEGIESDPTLWKTGFSLEVARIKIRQWADKYGERILKLIQ